MTLPEDDVGAFEDFAHWLYTRGFEILPEPADAMFIAPLKLFVLADKYHVIDLKNIITEKIFNVGKRLGKATFTYRTRLRIRSHRSKLRYTQAILRLACLEHRSCVF